MKGDDVRDGIIRELRLFEGDCERALVIERGVVSEEHIRRRADRIHQLFEVALRSELAELALCSAHADEAREAPTGCVVCDVERELAELRGRGAGPLAVDEGAQAKPVAWMWPTMGGMQTATNPLNVPAHAKPLYAHPSVSAGERAQLGHDPYSVIVRTAKGADVEAFIAFVEEAGGSVRHRLTAVNALGVDLPHSRPFEMVAEIVKHPAVRWIETNHYMRICSPDSAVLPAPTEPAT